MPEEDINMDENYCFFQFLHAQLEYFLKEILSGTNFKNQYLFTESSSEPACLMNLRGTKTDEYAEKGREEFLEGLNSSHALLDKIIMYLDPSGFCSSPGAG